MSVTREDPMLSVSAPCLTDFMDDFPVEPAVVISSIGCSPGYESEDSGTGSSVVDFSLPLVASSVPSHDLGSPHSTMSVGDSYSESGDDLLTEISNYQSLVDNETDTDLLNYLVQSVATDSCDGSRSAMKVQSNVGSVSKNTRSSKRKAVSRHPTVMESKENNEVIVHIPEDEDCDDGVLNYDVNVDDSPPVVDKSGDSDLSRLYESVMKNHQIDSGDKKKRDKARVLKVVTYDQKSPGTVKGLTMKCAAKQSEESKRIAAAEQARLNRQKKKEYVGCLELQVSTLQSENQKLKKETEALLRDKDTLLNEVAYLKNVLANQSTLSGLLKNIQTTEGVSLSTSLSANPRKHAAEDDHNYGHSSPPKRTRLTKTRSMSGGICLHVDKNNVSLEFCAKCANMAVCGKRDRNR